MGRPLDLPVDLQAVAAAVAALLTIQAQRMLREEGTQVLQVLRVHLALQAHQVPQAQPRRQ